MLKKALLVLSPLMLFCSSLEKDLDRCIMQDEEKSCKNVYKFVDDRCKENSRGFCFLKANMLNKGIAVEKDGLLAFELTKDECEKNSAQACYDLSVFYLEGKVVNLDFDLSAQALDKACKLGSKKACDVLALVQ